MRNLAVIIFIIGLTGCAGTGIKNYQKDEILATAGDKSMPEWAERGETEPFWIEGGKVHSVGMAYIRGDEIPTAGARVAANNARSTISKAVENKMEFAFQQGAENFGFDSQVAKFIGAEVSSITSHSMREDGTWWKKVAQSDEDGSRKIRHVIFSHISMPETDFKAAVFKAANKGVTERKVSPEFQKQLGDQWSRFVEAKPTADSPKQE